MTHRFSKNVLSIIDMPEFTKQFLEQFKDCFEVETRFDTCSSSVKIRHVGHINEDTLVFEFATDEDKRFYRQAGDTGQDIEFIIVE